MSITEPVGKSRNDGSRDYKFVILLRCSANAVNWRCFVLFCSFFCTKIPQHINCTAFADFPTGVELADDKTAQRPLAATRWASSAAAVAYAVFSERIPFVRTRGCRHRYTGFLFLVTFDAWPWHSNSGGILYSAPNLQVSSSYVSSFGSYRARHEQTNTLTTHWQTNRRRWRHAPRFATLRRWAMITGLILKVNNRLLAYIRSVIKGGDVVTVMRNDKCCPLERRETMTIYVFWKRFVTYKQVIKVIWHKAASPPHMDGSPGGANVHPIYRKPKKVTMATSLRISKSAISSPDSLTPKTHP